MLLLLLATVFSFVSCGDKPTDPNEDPDDPTAHEHTYTEQVVNPTCKEKGYTKHTCECGQTYNDTYVDTVAHDLGEWETTVEPTCTADGTKKRECKNCEYSEMAKVDATGHSYTTSVVAPTCENRGYTLHTCTCGDTYSDNYVDIADHSFGDWFNTKNPTCTLSGTKARECEICDYYETETLEALGHSYTPEVIPPTCSEKGYTVHTCTCGDSTIDSYVDEIEHDYGAWTYIVQTFCTSNGEKERFCNDCGFCQRQVEEAPGHDYEVTVVDPTCDNAGYTLHSCKVCPDEVKDNFVAPRDHSYDQEIASSTYLKSAATCLNNALYYYSCVCGKKGTETFEYGTVSDHQKDSYGWCIHCDEVLDTTPTYGLIYDISDDGTYAILVYTSEYVQKNVSKIIVADTYEGLPVTTIGQGGANGTPFQKCENLTHVYLPDSVTTLASRAFDSCEELTTVKLSSALTSIGASAFTSCKKLESIVIPNGVTELMDYTFMYCSALKSIDLGTGITRINKQAFTACSSLESITIPNSVTYIAELTFSDCSALKTVNIGTGLTSIGGYAFVDCSSLESFSLLGTNVGQINNGAFQNCTSLKTVIFTDKITSIESNLFFGCTALENVTLGEKIYMIGTSAFANCTSINYNVKDGLNYLGSEEKPYLYLIGAASKDITSATIDSSCLIIYSYAFIGCTLENVVIPESVKRIMTNGFAGCTVASATFEKTSGWKYGMIDSISSSILSNATTAATHLTSNLEKDWVKY